MYGRLASGAREAITPRVVVNETLISGVTSERAATG